MDKETEERLLALVNTAVPTLVALLIKDGTARSKRAADILLATHMMFLQELPGHEITEASKPVWEIVGDPLNQEKPEGSK